MNRPQTSSLVFTISLWILAIVQIIRYQQEGSDHTDYVDAPSRAYVSSSFQVSKSAEPFHLEESVNVGDLLLSIDNKMIRTLDDIESVLGNILNDYPVQICIFRPSLSEKFDFYTPPSTLGGREFRRLPPSIMIRNVYHSGVAEEAGVQKGDILLAMDGKSFSDLSPGDPLQRITWFLAGLLSSGAEYAGRGDVYLARKGVGQTVRYDVLRNNDRLNIEIEIAAKRPLPFVLVIVLLSLPIAWVSYLVVKNKASPQAGVLVGMGVFIFAALLLRTSQSYGGLELVRDTLAVLMLLRIMNRPRDAHYGTSVVFATMATAFLAYIHYSYPIATMDGGYFSLSGIRVRLFERGFIPYAICWVTIFGVDYLRQIHFKILRRTSPHDPGNRVVAESLYTNQFETLVERLNLQTTSGRLSFYGQGIRSLVDALNISPDILVASSAKNDILEKEEEHFAMSFVAVRWCEMILPVLGFLGTVIGMGSALVNTADGVRTLLSYDTAREAALKDITEAFSGIGVAFDTTFLGLAGMLLVSVLHARVRKGLAVNIHSFRSLLYKVTEIWAMDALLRRQQEEKRFRDMVWSLTMQLIAEVDTVAVRRIRRALHVPRVQFQRFGRPISDDIKESVLLTLNSDGWEYSGHWSIPASSQNATVSTLKTPKERLILVAELKEDGRRDLYRSHYDYSSICASRNMGCFIAQTVNSELIYGVLPERAATIDTRPSKPRELFDARERLIPIRGSTLISPPLFFSIDRLDIGALPYKSGDAVDLYLMVMRQGEEPRRQKRLDESYEWHLFTISPQGAVIFTIGRHREVGTWRLQIIPITSRPQRVEGEATPHLSVSLDYLLDLQEVRDPIDVKSLSTTELLILDREGRLWYLDLQKNLQMELIHDDWTATPSSQCLIVPGQNGWFSVMSQGYLRMWQVRERQLVPHGTKFEVEGLKAAWKCLSSDNAKIVSGVTGQEIAMWSFPETFFDLARSRHE